MELTSISCGNCGAPLQIPADARFVTCNHCRSQLAVKHSDSVTYTEKLEELDERTEQLQEEVQQLRFQNELARIDRDWEREREGYMITDKHGRRHEPSVAGSVVGGIVAVGFGIFWMMMLPAQAGGFALFGVVFVLVGIGVSIYGYVRAQDYLRAERNYRRRRNGLYRKMHSR